MESIKITSWKVLAQEKGGGKVVAEYIFADEREAKLFQKDMKYKILVPLLLLSMTSYSSDHDDFSDERGMTKLLGPDTYLRCANFLSNPKSSTISKKDSFSD